MDDVNLLTRSVKPEEGSLQFPIKSENINTTIDIINDAAGPCSFVSAEWTALWYPKTRRI
jgi:hypothetical protein